MYHTITVFLRSDFALSLLALGASALFGSAWVRERMRRYRFIGDLLDLLCDIAVERVEQTVVTPWKVGHGRAKLDRSGQIQAQTSAERLVFETLRAGGVRIGRDVKNGRVRACIQESVRRLKDERE